MCDMPWDIYLDYLADQGFDDLREIAFSNLITAEFIDKNDELYDVYYPTRGLSEFVNRFGCGVNSLFRDIACLVYNSNDYAICEPACPTHTFDGNMNLLSVLWSGMDYEVNPMYTQFNITNRGDGTI